MMGEPSVLVTMPTHLPGGARTSETRRSFDTESLQLADSVQT